MPASDRLHRSRNTWASLLGAAMGAIALAVAALTAYIVYRYFGEQSAQQAIVAKNAQQLAAPAVLPDTVAAKPIRDQPISLANEPEGPEEDGQPTVASSLKAIGSHLRDAMELRPTAIIWLIDRSASAADARSELAEQLESFYRDTIAPAGAATRSPADGPPLVSVVAAFGKEIEFLTAEPTADVAAVMSCVSQISGDDSGVENTFAAIQAAAEKYLPLRKSSQRYVVIAALTDEVGDDPQQIEAALAVLRRNSIPVYVIGASAPFGRRHWPNAAQGVEPTPVIQGPESFEPELIDLEFVNSGGGVYSGEIARGDETIDSGMGPYSLTRLCLESGGQYFALPTGFGGSETLFGGRHAATTPARDPLLLRRYAPAYVSEESYRRMVAENKALAALVEAAALPKAEARFDWPRELSPQNEQRFRRALDEAQRAPARLMPKLDKLYETLKVGEADRDRLPEPRWQAGYDLAMGRALAAKARTESFVAMLAVMKQGKTFANPKSTAWVIERADEISVSSTLDRLRERAHEYLQRVVKEHPHTPWADLAQRELDVPIGWKWVEK